MKGIVLFGAGASHGTSNVLPSSPPLGADLYSNLTQVFPNTWGLLPDQLDSSFQTSFEDGMELVWRNHSQLVSPLVQDMACFFAQYRLDGTQKDYYSRFILDLKSKGKLDDYAFSTINYECLIEYALNLAERKICYGPDYSNEQNTSTLWKLHGSCNFTVAGVDLAKGLASYLSGASFYGLGINLINPSQVSSYCATSALYPCMSLYAPGKPNQMARAVIESMQKNWQLFVSNADKVIVIGVASHPPDSHIWDCLASCPGHLYYIGGQIRFNSWVTSYREVNTYTYLGGTFEGSYENLITIL